MKRTLQSVFLAILAAEVLVVGQGAEVKRLLSEIRTALGGEAKLSAIKTVAVQGQTTISARDGSSTDQAFEMAFELPSGAIKFVRKNVLMNVGDEVISRRLGFNGEILIDDVQTPPSLGGNIRMMRMSGEGAISNAQSLLTNRREFARLALGMFGTSTEAYPVEFTSADQADSPDGKADVLGVKSADGFAAKLFVSTRTHLPVMMVWTDKEPLRITTTMAGPAGGGGAVQIVQGGRVMSGVGQSSDDPAKLQEELAARMKEAEANRKMVEYQLVYADYKSFDGVRLPTRLRYLMNGQPTEVMNLEKIAVNGKIDSSMFAVVK